MITTSTRFNVKKLERDIREYATKTLSKKVNAAISDNLRDTMRYAANAIFREEVANLAPTPEEEHMMLSIGTDDRGRIVGTTTDSSRFMKAPRFLYLQDAIRTDAKFSINTIRTANNTYFEFSLTEGSRNKINNEIGFAWMKRISKDTLQRRSTLDTEAYRNHWGFLLEKWEDGGLQYGGPVYTVKSREGGMLHPGPGNKIASKYVTKTLKPHNMFRDGMSNARQKIFEFAFENLSKRFKL